MFAEFFYFLPFFRKMFTFRPLDVSLYFLDPEFGAVAIGAQVTHLGAIIISAEI